MREARADWQMVSYGGAVHSFTNPDAGKAGIQGVAYNEKAALRSWTHMEAFFDEIFARR
jgi:dienelactone hydrolase